MIFQDNMKNLTQIAMEASNQIQNGERFNEVSNYVGYVAAFGAIICFGFVFKLIYDSSKEGNTLSDGSNIPYDNQR